MKREPPPIFAGSASGALTSSICQVLALAPAAGEMLHFPEGDLLIDGLQNAGGRSTYVIQSSVFGASAATAAAYVGGRTRWVGR